MKIITVEQIAKNKPKNIRLKLLAIDNEIIETNSVIIKKEVGFIMFIFLIGLIFITIM